MRTRICMHSALCLSRPWCLSLSHGMCMPMLTCAYVHSWIQCMRTIIVAMNDMHLCEHTLQQSVCPLHSCKPMHACLGLCAFMNQEFACGFRFFLLCTHTTVVAARWCMFVRTCVHTCMYVRMYHMYKHSYVNTGSCMYICMYACMYDYICMFARVCKCVSVWTRCTLCQVMHVWVHVAVRAQEYGMCRHKVMWVK